VRRVLGERSLPLDEPPEPARRRGQRTRHPVHLGHSRRRQPHAEVTVPQRLRRRREILQPAGEQPRLAAGDEHRRTQRRTRQDRHRHDRDPGLLPDAPIGGRRPDRADDPVRSPDRHADHERAGAVGGGDVTPQRHPHRGVGADRADAGDQPPRPVVHREPVVGVHAGPGRHDTRAGRVDLRRGAHREQAHLLAFVRLQQLGENQGKGEGEDEDGRGGSHHRHLDHSSLHVTPSRDGGS